MFTEIDMGERIVTPRVRIMEPFGMMKEKFGAGFEILDDVLKLQKDEEAQIFFRARRVSESVEQGVGLPKLLRQYDYLIISEIDDSLTRFPNIAKMKYVDYVATCAVTCSTETLADEVREFNPYVKVFKNQIATLAPEKKFEDKDEITIFFGAVNRSEEWDDIMPIINKFAKKYGKKLRFIVISDIKFFNALESQNKFFVIDKSTGIQEFVSYNVYMNELYRADIALLPLKDNIFNRAKSDLKFIESANAQVAVLASPTVYESVIKDGETGFIYRNPREFQAKLKILIENKAKRIELSKAAYEYIKRERLLVNHIEERYNWFKEMYQKRDELYNDLYKRCERFEEDQKKEKGF